MAQRDIRFSIMLETGGAVFDPIEVPEDVEALSFFSNDVSWGTAL